jgi:hypothetical protein
MKFFSLVIAVLVVGNKISTVTANGAKAVDDPNVVTTYNTPVTFDAIGNDKNSDGTPLLLGPNGSGSNVTIVAAAVWLTISPTSAVGDTFTSGEVVTLPNGGTVSANFTDGMITYTPPYWGGASTGVPLSQDTFTYAFQITGDVNTPANNGYSNYATVTITISEDTSGPGDTSVQGDPHFKAWRGQHYDYHGECDLIFLQTKEFELGMGLDVHIRTKIRGDMSYISSAVLRIGADVLEVQSQGVYYLNGAANAELPSKFSGFEFLHTQPTDKQHVFEVHLGGRERIKLKTYKDFVSVVIEQGLSKHFGKSVGLMGDFGMGHMIARDGKTVVDDANAFGQEWQVLDTEPTLFQTVRFPQHPQKCTMPTPKTTDMLRRRLLGASSVDELAAEKACEHWGEQGKDDCVFDVLTTGDLEMAMVGAF